MQRANHRGFKFDWIIIILFLLLVGFGWVNIMSASHVGDIESYFDMSQPYGKQSVFIILSFILIAIILSIESKFYERFSSIIYLVAILSLIGLLIGLGKNVNGATSWYGFGSITIQPSEFAKFATALAVAKYISDLQTNMKTIVDQLKTVAIIVVPAILILLQNDAGSTIVYAAFFFVFFREGLQQIYLIIGVILILLSVLSLKFGITITAIIVTLFVIAIYFFRRKKRASILQSIVIVGLCIGFSFGVKMFYEHGLKPHQQNRISLWLRLEKDPAKLELMKKREAYNLLQSEEAISSGRLTGKGFLQGTRTKGKFVPEQHTDYIFSTVGEEWGFLGSATVVILFVLLIIRILYLAEAQKLQFSRVYGYSVASILFIHFMINIGMVMGLIPTVGIPLPFFSYGGSGLWGFTILLFIFVKLDSNKINEW